MISVVMCAYNVEPFVRRAVESILAQTYADFELVIVDDGSTDATPAILRDYARRDRRVQVMQGEHRGISAAANRGLARAERPWIARMDADDIAPPHRFERQLAAAAEDPRVAVWGGYALYINDAGKVLGVSRTGPTSVAEFEALNARADDVYVIQGTWLARRDLMIAAGGYDERLECCEDLELLDRMSALAPTLTIPEPLLFYRVHANSVSMRRFATMRRLSRFVGERRRARRAGRTLTLEEFTRRTGDRPRLTRAAMALDTLGAFCYRRSGLSFANGRVLPACAWFAGAALVHPRYAVPRIWNQVLSAPARHARTHAGGPADTRVSRPLCSRS